MAPDLSSYKELYLQTAKGYLEKLTNSINVLSSNPSEKSALENAYVAFHSLKAQSSVMSFTNVAELCGVLGSIIQNAKDGKIVLTKELLRDISQALESLGNCFTVIEKEGHDVAFPQELQQLHAFTS